VKIRPVIAVVRPGLPVRRVPQLAFETGDDAVAVGDAGGVLIWPVKMLYGVDPLTGTVAEVLLEGAHITVSLLALTILDSYRLGPNEELLQ
jgi:hypothetical protein